VPRSLQASKSRLFRPYLPHFFPFRLPGRSLKSAPLAGGLPAREALLLDGCRTELTPGILHYASGLTETVHSDGL
jgi:hypothetical protein